MNLDEGERLLSLGRFEDASKILGQVIDSDPGNVRAYYLQGCALYNIGESHDALRLLEYAHQQEGNSVAILIALAEVLRALREPAKALSYASRAQELSPNDSDVLHVLGTCYCDMSEFDKAISYFRFVLRLAPGDLDARFNLANCLVGNEEFVEAAAEYTTVLSERPDDASCHLGLGIALAANDEHEKALLEFNQAFKLDPNSLRAKFETVRSLAATGRVNDASSLYRELVATPSDTSEFACVHAQIGFDFLQAEAYDEAILALTTRLSESPEDWASLFNLGLAQLNTGKIADARRTQRKLRGLNPAESEELLGVIAEADERSRNSP